MTKIFYQSSIFHHTIAPACESSLKTVTGALSEARNISFPRDLGFKEIVHDLGDFQQRHQYFLSWGAKCTDSLTKNAIDHEQIVHLIPSVEIPKRVPLVK